MFKLWHKKGQNTGSIVLLLYVIIIIFIIITYWASFNVSYVVVLVYRATCNIVYLSTKKYPTSMID